MKNQAEHAFSAVRIEGGLLPPAFLQRVAVLDAPSQVPSDYGVPKGLALRDEIGRYWRMADAAWRDYRLARLRSDLPPEKTGIENWLVTVFQRVLGYDDLIDTPNRTIVWERSFPISHRSNSGAIPPDPDHVPLRP